MKIEIDIDEYFTPEMIKEIAEDELRRAFRRQFQKESDVERVIANLSSEFVFTLIAEQWDGDFTELLRKKIKDAIEDDTITQPNEWISVEERLPEDEARQYIEDDLDGIGYLYPCLLTYKSPNTERIHVVRFYYDIIQKWFVNNGEELCEKGRCIAWMPLPAPYDRRPPEGET